MVSVAGDQAIRLALSGPKFVAKSSTTCFRSGRVEGWQPLAVPKIRSPEGSSLASIVASCAQYCRRSRYCQTWRQGRPSPHVCICAMERSTILLRPVKFPGGCCPHGRPNHFFEQQHPQTIELARLCHPQYPRNPLVRHKNFFLLLKS